MTTRVLAYPESHEKRDKLIEAFKAWLIRYYLRGSKSRKALPENLRRYPTRQIYKSGPITNAGFRIQKRVDTARFIADILAFKAAKHLGAPVSLSGEEPSVNKLTTRLGRLLGKDPTYIKRWYWAPTVPVLHLAVAFNHHLIESKEESIDLFQLILRPDWVESALTSAETHRLYYLRPPVFNIPDSNTIQLLPKKSAKFDTIAYS